MAKRVLFISSFDTTGDRLRYDGVTKKIALEIRTLYEMSYDVDYIERKDNNMFLCNDKTNSRRLLMPVKGSFHKTMSELFSLLTKTITPSIYDYVYMRYEHVSVAMDFFLKYLKKGNPQIVIFGELPTYMGKWEPGASFFEKIRFILKRFLQLTLSSGFDRILTFSNHKKLFGVKTVQIENFADVEHIPVRTPKECSDLHMLGVAMLTPSHGFDRVISGLYEYYADRPHKKVYFHIVGSGSVLPEWKALAKKLKLENYVFFEGLKTSDELNAYFNNNQIAVASLGSFRKKSPKHSELKIREYTARGIPFFYSALEPQFEGQPFCLKVPHDESPININNIIDFCNRLNVEHATSEMREFALKNCTCRAQFERIFSEVI